jgi:hypothetical protein
LWASQPNKTDWQRVLVKYAPIHSNWPQTPFNLKILLIDRALNSPFMRPHTKPFYWEKIFYKRIKYHFYGSTPSLVVACSSWSELEWTQKNHKGEKADPGSYWILSWFIQWHKSSSKVARIHKNPLSPLKFIQIHSYLS